LFGGSDDETTTTMTFTNTEATDISNEEKVTNTVTLYSGGPDDPYDVLIFFDRTFSTYLYASKGAAVLQGGQVVTGVFTPTREASTH
jgi:hypothetical protein